MQNFLNGRVHYASSYWAFNQTGISHYGIIEIKAEVRKLLIPILSRRINPVPILHQIWRRLWQVSKSLQTKVHSSIYSYGNWGIHTSKRRIILSIDGSCEHDLINLNCLSICPKPSTSASVRVRSQPASQPGNSEKVMRKGVIILHYIIQSNLQMPT